jgi:hypothetical protein
VIEGFRICHPKIHHFDRRVFFELKAIKNYTYRKNSL